MEANKIQLKGFVKVLLPRGLMPGVLPTQFQFMRPGTSATEAKIDGKLSRPELRRNEALAQKFSEQIKSDGSQNPPSLKPRIISPQNNWQAAEIQDFVWAGTDPRTGGIHIQVTWLGQWAGQIQPQWGNLEFRACWQIDSKNWSEISLGEIAGEFFYYSKLTRGHR